jgi:teichuronic acid biosynthesis glycosyltransferase TuaG
MHPNETPPLISIITPVYNSERFLLETIRSVQGQTYKNYEHLLIIDAKTVDASVAIARQEQSKDQRIKTIQTPKALSIAVNRNIGIDRAQGEYLAFLDADDTWSPDKLEKQISFAKTTGALISFSAFYRMSEDSTRISEPTSVAKKLSYFDLLKLNSIALHTVLLKNEFVGEHRFADVVHEDFAFWLELLRPSPTAPQIFAYGLNEPLAYYRSVRGSRASNKRQAALWRWKILTEFEKLPLAKAVYYFCQYAIRATLLHQKTRV